MDKTPSSTTDLLLEGWPYNYERVEGTLEPADIETQGKLLLYRALNIGNLVTLVGSGVSTAYGRVSWTTLCSNHFDLIIEHVTALCGTDLASRNPDMARLHGRIVGIRDQLTKGEIKGDDLTFVLEICEQFWRVADLDFIALVAHDHAIDMKDVPSNVRHDPGRILFRRLIMREVIDEYAHLRSLLTNAGLYDLFKDDLAVNKESTDGPWLQALREIFCETTPLSRQASEIRKRLYAPLFSYDLIQAVKDTCSGKLRHLPLTTSILALLEMLRETSPTAIPPSAYFLVHALYVCLVDEAGLTAHEMKDILGKVSAPRFPGRSAIVPMDHDQLHLMAYELELKRFATLNWDLEIERFMFDANFRLAQGDRLHVGDGEVERYGPLGGRARDMTLLPAEVTNLADFALNSDEYNLQVVHLHGRATDEDELVLTGADYRRAYAADHRYNTRFRQGLDLTFGGNPVLFIGIGLTEGDVLRPFRELIARQPNRSRAIIAFRAAKDPAVKRDIFTMNNFMERGMYVLHYGLIPADDFEKMRKIIPELDDPSIFRILDVAFDHMKSISDNAILNNKRKKLRNYRQFQIKWDRISRIEFSTDIGENYRIIYNIISKIFIYYLKHSNGPGRKPTREKIVPILKDGLVGLAENFSVIYMLGQTRSEWTTWWSNWQTVPPDRYPSVRFHHIGSGDQMSFGRHRVSSDLKLADGFKTSPLWPFVANRPARDRRVLVIHAGEGGGRGCAFLLLSQLVIHRDAPRGRSFFANLNFSSEIASVLDAIINFLNGAETFKPGPPTGIGSSRLERLEMALKQRQNGPRILIAINAFDVLLQPDGTPKTSEIEAYFRRLLGDAGKACCVDIVLTCRTSRLPWLYRVRAGQGMAEIPLMPMTNSGPMIRPRGNLVLDLGRWEKDGFFTMLCANRVDTGGRRIGRHVLCMQNRLHDLLEQIASDATRGGEFARIRRRPAIRTQPDRNDAGTSDALIADIFDDWTRVTQALRALGETSDGVVGRWLAAKELPMDPEDPIGITAFLDVELQEALVRHLAVISIPVTSSVLIACPAIITLLDERKDLTTADKRIAYVDAALNILRGGKSIIFGMEKQDDGGEDGPMPQRFQVHRSIQHYIYRRLGTQASVPGDGYYFAPSLYTSQARDLPRLHASSYRFLYELVDALSGYPVMSPRPDMELMQRVQCARAALGVVRTLFSVGVVSRFGNVEAMSAPRGTEVGYLEHHRLVVRWMLHIAGRISSETIWPPFYKDETVWLLNEAGVFSHAQGRSKDAVALFRKAMAVNREIEGADGGMAHRRLLLNDGLCSIDRGRLVQARRSFDRVAAATDETPMIRAMATGFAGLVDHLEGRHDAALAAYDEALKHLDGVGRMRSVSYIRRHRADLLRRMGRPAEARRDLDMAIHAADAGGYADFRHFAEVSEVRLWLDQKENIGAGLERLDAAEIYADRMDMPRLKVEILRTRAAILLQQGESRIASDIAAEAIRIANLNDLVLRRINCTDLLARIYHRQGDEAGAAHLRDIALRAARVCRYVIMATPASDS